ncbi:unnamed protein product [Urochloa humidicola]
MELHHDPPRGFKGAFDYKLHIHLDVVEDLSFFGGRGGGDGHNRKPRREFLWTYGAPDSFGERRSEQSHDNRATRDYRPRRDRDDHDDNFNRGVRRHRSQSSWGRMTRCRRGVEDCYSSTCYRGGEYGHRSRAIAPSGCQRSWRKKADTGRRVTFANPLVQIMGHPSKEECIRKMLASAPGWDPVASPTIQPAAVEGLQHHHDKTAQHLPQPLTETTMGAIKTLVEQGNKPRNKKKSRVTPMPATAAMAQEA